VVPHTQWRKEKDTMRVRTCFGREEASLHALSAPLSNGVSGITTAPLVDVGSSGFGKGEFFDC